MLNLSATMEKFKRQMEAQGIDVTPYTKEEMQAREERLKKQWIKNNEQQKLKIWHKESLWSGDQPIHFTFKDWKPDKQLNRQLAADLGNRAYLVAKELTGDSFNVLMTGKPGTGKTSLALAIGDYLEQNAGKKYLFISTMALGPLFSDSYHRVFGAEEKVNRLFKKAKAAPVLIIDDFGTEGGMRQYGSGEDSHYRVVRNDVQSWLYRLSDARYGADKATIITTNNRSQDLVQMYNPKLLSRLIPKKKDHIIDFKGMEDVRS